MKSTVWPSDPKLSFPKTVQFQTLLLVRSLNLVFLPLKFIEKHIVHPNTS